MTNHLRGKHGPSSSVKKAVKERDGFVCRYCGRSESEVSFLTVDHVVPRSKGGSNGKNNLVTACDDCNQEKADEAWCPKCTRNMECNRKGNVYSCRVCSYYVHLSPVEEASVSVRGSEPPVVKLENGKVVEECHISQGKIESGLKHGEENLPQSETLLTSCTKKHFPTSRGVLDVMLTMLRLLQP